MNYYGWVDDFKVCGYVIVESYNVSFVFLVERYGLNQFIEVVMSFIIK